MRCFFIGQNSAAGHKARRASSQFLVGQAHDSFPINSRVLAFPNSSLFSSFLLFGRGVPLVLFNAAFLCFKRKACHLLCCESSENDFCFRYLYHMHMRNSENQLQRLDASAPTARPFRHLPSWAVERLGRELSAGDGLARIFFPRL